MEQRGPKKTNWTKPECDLREAHGDVDLAIDCVTGCLTRAGLRDQRAEWLRATEAYRPYADVRRIANDYVIVVAE